MTRPIPLSALTLYADLVQQAQTASRDEATVVATTVRGIRYLRLQRWVGAARTVEHLGREDAPDVQARAEVARREMLRREERRRLVAGLRRWLPGPPPKLGKVLDALAASGLFARGAVLVGTAAYACYPPLVGEELPSGALMTQDADLATADLALTSDVEGLSMEAILRRADASFTAVLGLDPRRPAARFRSADGFLVDLLTPRRRRTDPNPIPLAGLGAAATPLQQLDWLIQDPVEALALHGAGVLLRVPQPARYAVHKLIVAQKRDAGEAPKRRKDLVQAAALLDILGRTDPYRLEDALADAQARGRAGWAQPIERSLREIGRS